MPAIDAKSWPFEQAKLLVKKFGLEYGSPYPDKHVLFQTGFGATGTGHAGTFSEITRTNMVRVAFEHLAQEITGNKNPPSTILVTFADDYDALRRVPEGCPKSMEQDLGLPVTSVRDPSGEYRSFGERNVEALRKFSTDYMNISPAILSATELYTSGRFNAGMIDVCKNYDAIMDIMLPTLGGQGGNRRDTYSPIMPISTVSGRVLQVPVSIIDADNGIIEFLDEDGSVIRTSALNGAAKLQWKVDWAMRWHQLGVDYEMYGKDLIDSFVVSKKIVKLFGSEPPVGMSYELFVDENGKKISKSVGNGVSVEEWMQYGTPDALSMFMFQSPKSSKALYLDVIPRVSDDYLRARTDFPKLFAEGKHFDNAAWHIHGGNVPSYSSDVNYGLLVNLASVSNATDPDVLREYLKTYRSVDPSDMGVIDDLIPRVINYVQTRVLPNKVLREPTDLEKIVLITLAMTIDHLKDENLDGAGYQQHIYEVGKTAVANGTYSTLRDFFKSIYEVFFGASEGPRFGTFVAAYGAERTYVMMMERLVPHVAEIRKQSVTYGR